MDERDQYVAIFNANRDAIAAGRAIALDQKRVEKQLRKEQSARCLQCASGEAATCGLEATSSPIGGCATGKGFLCTIHPLGLEMWQIPCADWLPRT